MKFLGFICIVLVGVNCYAQLDTVQIGAEYKTEKQTAFEGFIGMDSTGFYSLDYEYVSKKKHNLYLNKYDSKSLDRIFTKSISPQTVGEQYIEPVEIFNLNRRIYLVAKFIDPEKDLKRITIYPISNGGILGEAILLDTIFSLQENVNDFRIVPSDKDQNFVLVTRKPFFQSQNTSYNVRKYDAYFNLVWEDVVSLPYEAKNFEFKDISFDGEDKLMVLMKRMDISGMVSNKLKNIENNKYNLWVFNHENKSLKEFEISLKDKWIIDVKIVYKNKKIFVAGYFSNEKTISLKGFFSLIFDASLNVLAANVKSMTKEDFALFYNIDKVNEKTHLYDFYLKGTYVLDNEEIVLIGEKYYKEIDNFYDPRSDISTYTDVYNYNSVLVTKMSKNGSVIENIKIPKYQSTINDNGYYSSIVYGVKQNDVWIFFNDDEKNIEMGNDLDANYKPVYNNRKVVPVYVKIDSSNKVTRKSIPMVDDGFLLVPKYSDQLEDQNFYLIKERGRSAKVVRFKTF